MKFIDTLKSWWHNHAQKIFASIFMALTIVDTSGYAGPIKALAGDTYGAKIYAALQILCGLAILVRAVQANQATKQPQ